MANLNTGFETIRNNTALKHDEPTCERLGCFETIRNNTALKHEALFKQFFARFETILMSQRRNKSVSDEFRLKHNLKKHTIVPLSKDEQTPTLTTLPDDYIHYAEPRILTVREYARIQSFPDHYEFKGMYTTGGTRRKVDVPRYTQIGNAIPPLFAEQAGLVLKEMF